MTTFRSGIDLVKPRPTLDYQSQGGFEYEKEPYDTFAAGTLAMTSVTHHQLAESTRAGTHILGVSVGDPSNPAILIDGGIHGAHEWRSCYWVRRFAQTVAEPSGPNASFYEYLAANYYLYSVPCLNPYGYVNNDRKNGNGVDLNRNADHGWEEWDMEAEPYGGPKGSAPWSEPEAAVVRDLVTTLKPILYVNCHSEGGFDRCNFERATLAHDEWTTGAGRMLAALGGTVFYGRDTTRPKVAVWAGTQTDSEGRPTYALTFESGDQRTESIQAQEGVDGLTLLCMAAVARHEGRAMLID